MHPLSYGTFICATYLVLACASILTMRVHSEAMNGLSTKPNQEVRNGLLRARAGTQAGTPGYNFLLKTYPDIWSIKNNTNSTDFAGVYISVIARLVSANATQPDQRALAKYYLGVGGDMYTNQTAGATVGIGRFKRVTAEYQAFNSITYSGNWTDTDILLNPPPVQDSLAPQVSLQGLGF
jgi:hypothetical protein